MSDDGIGCAACFGGSAEQVSQARRRLAAGARLVDDSHFSVLLRVCGVCGQRFVDVFSERIDWQGGNDPQAWLLVPVSDDEANRLRGLDEASVEGAVLALSPKRRCLDEYWPSEGGRIVRFSQGPLMIMPHD